MSKLERFWHYKTRAVYKQEAGKIAQRICNIFFQYGGDCPCVSYRIADDYLRMEVASCFGGNCEMTGDILKVYNRPAEEGRKLEEEKERIQIGRAHV